MRSAAIGEWIIARLTSRKQAASMVGDLVELEPQKGMWWFRLSLARVVVALVWRRPVALIAASYAGLWAFSGFEVAIWGVHAQHRPPEHPWIHVLGVLAGTGMITWTAAMYTAIRYGLRDRVAQFALVLAGLVTAVIYCWWQPAILATCIALSICMLWASIGNSERRRAAMVLLTALAAGNAGLVLATYLAGQYQHWVHPGPMGERDMQEHPSIALVFMGLWLMTACITGSACSLMRRRLLRGLSIEDKPAV
jgi:hypothetical protein